MTNANHNLNLVDFFVVRLQLAPLRYDTHVYIHVCINIYRPTRDQCSLASEHITGC